MSLVNEIDELDSNDNINVDLATKALTSLVIKATSNTPVNGRQKIRAVKPQKQRQLRAGCVLFNGDRFLSVHNIASDMWGFPKGRRLEGESPIDNAIRELFEETGKVVLPGDVVKHLQCGADYLYIFRGDFDPVCIVDGIEIDQYEWITLDELKKRKTSNFTKIFLRKLSQFR